MYLDPVVQEMGTSTEDPVTFWLEGDPTPELHVVDEVYDLSQDTTRVVLSLPINEDEVRDLANFLSQWALYTRTARFDVRIIDGLNDDELILEL